MKLSKIFVGCAQFLGGFALYSAVQIAELPKTFMAAAFPSKNMDCTIVRLVKPTGNIAGISNSGTKGSASLECTDTAGSKPYNITLNSRDPAHKSLGTYGRTGHTYPMTFAHGSLQQIHLTSNDRQWVEDAIKIAEARQVEAERAASQRIMIQWAAERDQRIAQATQAICKPHIDPDSTACIDEDMAFAKKQIARWNALEKRETQVATRVGGIILTRADLTHSIR